MTIYLDIVLLENLIMNYIILCATAIIVKTEIKILRLFFSSLIGGAYAIIGYVSALPIYSTLILKILLSIIMIYVAFYPQSIKKMLKELLIFYLTSFLFGGVAFFLLYYIKSQNILTQNEVLIGIYPIKVALLGAIIGSVIILTSFKIIKSKISNKDMICEVNIIIDKKEIETKAMIDTGNLLKEPISNMPVIVVEHTLLYEVIPKEILNNLEKILGGDLKNIPEDIKNKYLQRLKIIPYASLGKQNGMLIGIRADKILIKYDEEIKENDKIIVGIYNKSLTKKGEYRALIGIELLND